MDNKTSSTAANQKNDQETSLEQLFAEMNRLNALMQQDPANIDRIKAETKTQKQELLSL